MKKENKILTIDPSGDGTTGYCLIDEQGQITFTEFFAVNWLAQFAFLVKLLNKEKPTQIIYEHTNYIHKKTASAISLFKLFGAIETLKYLFPFLTQITSLSASQVKQCYTRLYENKEQLPNLTYKIGRGNGWKYHHQPLSRHQIDALIVYHLWNKNHVKPN